MERIKKTMIKAIKSSGKVVNESREKIKEITMKSYKDFVTNVDLESEKIITEIIREKFPDHIIYSEEKGIEEKNSDYEWVIDPLDGTHNYLFNIPFFAISIGLSFKRSVIMGAVLLPAFNELYFAGKGGDASLNGKPIKVAEQETLIDSLILYDNQFHNHENMLPNYIKIVDKSFTTRILGSAASDLCFVARGYADARILHKPKLCDFAAGALIVEEAGGKVTDFKGKHWNIDTKSVIASNGKIHDELLKILKK